MAGSKQVKREFGFLWRIIGAFFAILATNSMIKSTLDQSISLMVSFGLMSLVTIVLVVIYSVKMKPFFNQIVLFFLSLGITLFSTIFFIYDLPYKNLMGGVSIPLILIFCGMWVYGKYATDEVK